MIDFGGPTTSSLTEICSEILKKNNCMGILSSLDAIYGEGEYNFETIIAAIEYLCDWSLAKERLGYVNAQNINVITSVFCSKFQSLSNIDYWNIYAELINRIIDVVKKYDYETSIRNEHILLQHFFENVINKNKTKIYSLNYDRLIPHLVNDNFFDGTQSPDYKYYNYNLNEVVKSGVSYVNLHGSIYLSLEPNNYYKAVQCSIPQYLRYAHELDGGSPNEIKLFSPIIAGYSKSQRIMSEPFNFGIGAFMEDCNLCDEFVIVGYSFSDPHINSIIKNYVRMGKVQITIVDKKDASIVEQNLVSKMKIYSAFGMKSGILCNKNFNISIHSNGFIDYIKNYNRQDMCPFKSSLSE